MCRECNDKIEAVFTDLDGVIRHWKNSSLLALENVYKLPRGITHQYAFREDLLYSAITGRINHKQWCEEVLKSLSETIPKSMAITLVDTWATSPFTIDKDIIRQFRSLFPNAILAVVSNATSRLEGDLSGAGIAKDFDYVINSSQVGHAKPNAEIYWEALRISGCVAEKSVFIDDSKPNVLTANTLGFKAVHFTDKEDALVQLGKLAGSRSLYTESPTAPDSL